MFYVQLEDGGSVGIGAGGEGEVAQPTEEDPEILPRGSFAYAASSGDSSYKRLNVDGEESSIENIDVGATISNDDTSPGFQLSSNSLVSAVRTSGGIVVKNLEEQTTVLADQIGSVSQWLLLPDGTRIFALVGTSLHSYDTTTGSGGEVAGDFIPAGSDVSRLSYGRRRLDTHVC